MLCNRKLLKYRITLSFFPRTFHKKTTPNNIQSVHALGFILKYPILFPSNTRKSLWKSYIEIQVESDEIPSQTTFPSSQIKLQRKLSEIESSIAYFPYPKQSKVSKVQKKIFCQCWKCFRYSLRNRIEYFWDYQHCQSTCNKGFSCDTMCSINGPYRHQRFPIMTLNSSRDFKTPTLGIQSTSSLKAFNFFVVLDTNIQQHNVQKRKILKDQLKSS